MFSFFAVGGGNWKKVEVTSEADAVKKEQKYRQSKILCFPKRKSPMDHVKDTHSTPVQYRQEEYFSHTRIRSINSLYRGFVLVYDVSLSPGCNPIYKRYCAYMCLTTGEQEK